MFNPGPTKSLDSSSAAPGSVTGHVVEPGPGIGQVLASAIARAAHLCIHAQEFKQGKEGVAASRAACLAG